MKKQFRFWSFITLMGYLVLSVVGCGNTTSNPDTPSTTNSGAITPQTSSAVTTGEADYTHHCTTCHESPPTTKNLQQITKVINSGRGRMPGYKDKLNDSQIKAIADYIVSGR